VFTTIMKQERRSQKSPEVTGKILLVDPNPLDLETYTDILQHFGHEVRMCSSYDEALHMVERDNFDLVIIGESGSQFGGRIVLGTTARRRKPRTESRAFKKHGY